jgi:hypothetical protein
VYSWETGGEFLNNFGNLIRILGEKIEYQGRIKSFPFQQLIFYSS